MKLWPYLVIFLAGVEAQTVVWTAHTFSGNTSIASSNNTNCSLIIWTYDLVAFRCQLGESFHYNQLTDCMDDKRLFRADAVGAMHLANCRLLYISFDDLFEAYQNLRVLDISSLGVLWRSMDFAAANRLVELNVSHNQLDYIDQNILAKASNLTKVDLSFNELGSVEAFTYIADFPQLKWMDLSHNAIEVIPTAAFSRLGGLQYLNLSYNRLDTISFDMFAASSILKQLDVSFNGIHSIEGESLPQAKRIESFITHGNPVNRMILEQPNDKNNVGREASDHDTANELFLWLGAVGVAIILLVIALVAVLLAKRPTGQRAPDEKENPEPVEASEVNSLYSGHGGSYECVAYAYVADNDHNYDTLNMH